jgi:hypothetical protein
MSTWRVEQHYGFGAARIPIQPEPHRAVRVGFSEGMGTLVRELTEGGVVATMRRAAGEASAILLSLLILAAVVVTLTRDYSDVSSIDVVLLETIVRDPQPLIEEVEEGVIPAPVPVEIAKPEPPKRVEPKPTPPPQQIAQKPKPPPIAKPKPRSRPKPVIPQIARIEAPKPPPVQKLDRSVRERPQQIARPRVAIEAARPKLEQAAPTPRMDRIARRPVERTSPTRRTPQMNTPAAPALDRPREEPSKRAFRVASAKPTPGKRPRALPGIAPVPRQGETVPTSTDARPTRSSGPRATAPRPTRGPAPKLSSAPVPMPTSSPTATPKRGARLAPANPTRRAPRPTAQIARATKMSEPTMPTPASRSGRASPQAPRGSKADLNGVAGVPLGDLAACLSDREEDRLKQAVVAAVTTQEECISSKGTYRFIETKNLNAFLMWIDRAPARPISDRCVELGYALECLQSAGRRAAR